MSISISKVLETLPKGTIVEFTNSADHEQTFYKGVVEITPLWVFTDRNKLWLIGNGEGTYDEPVTFHIQLCEHSKKVATVLNL